MRDKGMETTGQDFNRREFIKGASFGSVMLAMGGLPLQAEDAPGTVPADTGYSTDAPPMACAVIGCGVWGREIIQTLALLPKPDAKVFCQSNSITPDEKYPSRRTLKRCLLNSGMRAST